MHSLPIKKFKKQLWPAIQQLNCQIHEDGQRSIAETLTLRLVSCHSKSINRVVEMLCKGYVGFKLLTQTHLQWCWNSSQQCRDGEWEELSGSCTVVDIEEEDVNLAYKWTKSLKLFIEQDLWSRLKQFAAVNKLQYEYKATSISKWRYFLV